MLTLVPGCKGEQPTEETDDTTDDGACAGDEECGTGQICEAQACVTGDRDNGFDQATAVFQEQMVEGEISPDGDVDFWAYQSAGDEWLRIETTPEESEGMVDTVVAVYTAGGALHAWMDDYPTGNVNNYDTILYVYLPAAGTWYVTVEDRSTFYDNPDLEQEEGPYTLQIRPFGSVTDEPDDTDDPSVAIDLDNESTIYAVGVNLEEPGDADYIEVSIPWDRGPFEVFGHEDIPGSDAEPLVELWDPVRGVPLMSKENLGPDGGAIYFETLEQEYVVRATDGDADGSEDHWYVLYVRTRADDYYDIDFDAEPNDAADAAQALDVTVEETSDGTDYDRANMTGLLEADADEDWFEIPVGSNDSYVTIWCSSDAFGSFLDAAIDVYGPDGALLDTITDGSDSAPDVYNLGPVDTGAVTLRVYAEGATPAYGPGSYYYCSVFLTPFEVTE